MKNILLILTGGTMGMEASSDGRVDSSQFVSEIFHYVPELRKIANIDVSSPYTMDSSDVGVQQWMMLGKLIDDSMDDYDGFVVIHGTDTMSYTACALSYMLFNLPKPVILTGSQRPLAAIRTDARANLIQALELATKDITEVSLFFDNKLYRGNRTKKVSIDEFDAFASPNFPCLAIVGLNIEQRTRHRRPTGLFRLEPRFDERVLALKCFPSFRPKYWESLLDTDVAVVVLEAFGAGNLPMFDGELVSLIERFTQAGKLVVINSQTVEGECDLTLYENGQKALDAGAISAKDMTFEATIVKAMFLLGLYNGNVKRVRHYFHASIAGEISDPGSQSFL